MQRIQCPGWRQALRPCMLLVLLLALSVMAWAASAGEPKTVSVMGLWQGQSKGALPTDPVVKLLRHNPDIAVNEWAGITLPGAGGRTPLMLSIAGQSAPDLYYSWFHIVQSDIKQQFAYPINEWVGDDDNKNGMLDPDEVKWSGWNDEKVPPLWQYVATGHDKSNLGKVYGVPLPTINLMGIIFRIDLVKKAGLNPGNPPQTWDEFFYWCQKLTDPKQKRVALYLPAYGFTWLAWVSSAGGTPEVQVKRSPTTGKEYTFPMEATTFITPEGEDLSLVPSVWRANFDSDAAAAATGFYHKLRWQKWMKDPVTNEPINLTDAQIKAGKVTYQGRKVTVKKDDVIEGVITSFGGQATNVDWGTGLRRGDGAMVQWFFNDLAGYQQSTGIDPNQLGVFPIPAGPGGKPVVQVQRHYAVMSEGVGRRSKPERDAVWKVMEALTSMDAYDENIRNMVLSGKARFVNPSDLKRLHMEDYIREVPTSVRLLFEGIDNGTVVTRTEPYMGYWVSMDSEVSNSVLSLVLGGAPSNFDYKTALKEVTVTANTGTMFSRNPNELDKYRPRAWFIFAIVVVIVFAFVGLIIKTNLQAKLSAPEGGGSKRTGVYRPWLPWLMLFPALGSIALWGYYPLVRGMVMAFQDYHIVGESPFQGLDNFINIFLDPNFLISVRQTIKFVVLNMLFTFTAPIILALMLSEIPRGKVFWRSVFFLPQLTSGLVVTLLWRLMYDGNDYGILNQFIALFGMEPINWLGDVRTAMMATIIPSIWAGMGMASLIYLAALKGIPDELYEAASLDGAGLMAKLRYVTIPQLLPLILINFVGAFIGTFQSMGNIFLLTFGGPGKETLVLSMAIWKEAYANLRFSTATSLAWIMGSALIGFAYLQIRILRKVEYRRAEEN